LLTVIDSRDGPPADIAPQRRTTADFAIATPAIPIPFHKLLKVVAIVDGEDRQTRELLDHIAAERFQVEITGSFERDVSEDADVGAYIALIDGDGRDRARQLARDVRAIGFQTPLWALADLHRIADLAVLGMIGEVEGYIYLGQQTPAYYAKQVLASLVRYGTSLLPPFFGGLMGYDAEANVAFDCPGHQGGQFYRKSPAGQLFFKHFGEIRKVLEKIGALCEYVLWDEAWIGYNAFHPLFEDHSPMRLTGLGPEMPGLFSTQSVHKQGAGFSQASQIHKRDEHIRGQKRFIEHKRFNESFLMHASTSPFYPLFASLDVNAKVHEGKGGEMLWDRCIALGVETRKKLREFGHYYARTGRDEQARWFFDPFVPDVVSIRDSPFTADATDVAWESLPTEVITREQQCWHFQPSATWHGYAGYADGYAMVDPNKLTLLTPGLDRATGEYLSFGVPATVVANYLREEGIVPEKCDLNSLLFLMTPAEDESKLNTLIAPLVKFKELWDRDAMLVDVLPTLCAAHAARYAGYTVRQVCNEMHDFYRTAHVKDLQRLCFRASSFPELAMSPHDAYEALVANDVDYVPLDEVRGRISATLALIYPPGIGVVVPGERWDARAQPMLDYFRAFEESFNRFPGFNYEVQGVFQERVDGRIKFHTYVVRA
jgi:arginine/lysine/ornithine decarboxylase